MKMKSLSLANQSTGKRISDERLQGRSYYFYIYCVIFQKIVSDTFWKYTFLSLKECVFLMSNFLKVYGFNIMPQKNKEKYLASF